ncbi:class I SAM-dependent methyltransferase [Nocardia sp. bgisy118]|uniref:class I SAM-dependent methyltransferase n=1 Tax=Nocardia sp. bgisy118 TaxID=3413786 RepID=UPI003F49BB60
MRSQREVTEFYRHALADGAQSAERLSAPVSDRFAHFLNSIGDRVPGTALDLGYGMGTYTVALARTGFDVVAIDQVPATILRSRLDGCPPWAQRITLLEGRIENFVVTQHFDVVVAKDVLHYLRQDQVRDLLMRCIQRAPWGAAHFLEVFTDIHRTDRRGRRVLIEAEAAYTAATFRDTVETLYAGWNTQMSLEPHTLRNAQSTRNHFEANRITVCAHRAPATRPC